MREGNGYSTVAGSLVVVQMPGIPDKLVVAQVISQDPPTIKVTERGSLAEVRQKGGNFTILPEATGAFQNDNGQFWLTTEAAGQPVVTGLHKLGAMSDDAILTLFPPGQE